MVMSLDKRVSGEDRSILLKDKLANCYLYQDEDKIKGYYLPDLGEGLIIAQEVTAGLQLMKLRYKNKDRGVLPADNTTAIKFLLDNGFYEKRRVKRMFLGKKLVWGSAKIL